MDEKPTASFKVAGYAFYTESYMQDLCSNCSRGKCSWKTIIIIISRFKSQQLKFNKMSNTSLGNLIRRYKIHHTDSNQIY